MYLKHNLAKCQNNYFWCSILASATSITTTTVNTFNWYTFPVFQNCLCSGKIRFHICLSKKNVSGFFAKNSVMGLLEVKHVFVFAYMS